MSFNRGGGRRGDCAETSYQKTVFTLVAVELQLSMHFTKYKSTQNDAIKGELEWTFYVVLDNKPRISVLSSRVHLRVRLKLHLSMHVAIYIKMQKKLYLRLHLRMHLSLHLTGTCGCK